MVQSQYTAQQPLHYLTSTGPCPPCLCPSIIARDANDTTLSSYCEPAIRLNVGLGVDALLVLAVLLELVVRPLLAVEPRNGIPSVRGAGSELSEAIEPLHDRLLLLLFPALSSAPLSPLRLAGLESRLLEKDLAPLLEVGHARGRVAVAKLTVDVIFEYLSATLHLVRSASHENQAPHHGVGLGELLAAHPPRGQALLGFQGHVVKP